MSSSSGWRSSIRPMAAGSAGHAPGWATLHADGVEHRVEPGVFARVGPGVSRKITTGDEPVRLLAIGATPGQAYVAPAFTSRAPRFRAEASPPCLTCSRTTKGRPMGAPSGASTRAGVESGWTSVVAQPQPVLLPQDEQV